MKNILNYKRINITSDLKNLIRFFGLAIFAITISGCSSTRLVKPIDTRWNFDTLKGWVDGSQNMKKVTNYKINDGNLNIFTKANTWDRPKVRTKSKVYRSGKYSWRVFVPAMGVGDMSSIGAFLYFNDTHELDFEIGYGTAVVRKNLNAADDDLIVYMTSQSNPFKSIPLKIKRNQWYTLMIELLIVNGKYQAVWYINNTEMVRLNLEYGESIPFYIYCSVENLTFLGDHIPKQDNYALFDYVEFTK